MIKHCIVCGAEFTAPPSSKKVTCSPDCMTIRKRMSHQGKSNTWSPASKRRQSAAKRRIGFTDQARLALDIALALPDSQRGPDHRSAKVWILIDPDGRQHTVTNLLDWARRHADTFDIVTSDEDRERIANNIRTGFGNISLSMKGLRKHPVSSYKGWGLAQPPQKGSDTK